MALPKLRGVSPPSVRTFRGFRRRSYANRLHWPATFDAPEALAAYFGLQELLSGTREELIDRRRAGVREMFEGADAKAIEVERLRRAERTASQRDVWCVCACSTWIRTRRLSIA
jgi:hypothetical protein